jgi:hypothetical protein
MAQMKNTLPATGFIEKESFPSHCLDLCKRLLKHKPPFAKTIYYEHRTQSNIKRYRIPDIN